MQKVKNPGQLLPCPACKGMNTVNRASARLICEHCGATLRAIYVKKRLSRSKK